jgi:Flp pilus assembly protein CpaB
MIAAGLLALLLNVALLRSSDDTIDVLVAGNDITAGSRLVVADIEIRQIDADSPFGARTLDQTTVQPLLGLIVTRDIYSGAPLLADDLREGAAPDAGRAMSIPIVPFQAVAADIRRGDRVDVIAVVDGVAI